MKNLLLSVTFILFSLHSFGQETSPQTNKQFSINLLMPSLEWEVSLSQNSTIDLLAGTGFGYAKTLDSDSQFGIFPAFQSQYRYYYNLEKRSRKGKKNSENSGNYLAAVGMVQSANPIIGDMDLIGDYGVLIGPAWGLQRVYNSNFKLNLNLGAGYGFNDIGESYIAHFIGFQLGWLIAK